MRNPEQFRTLRETWPETHKAWSLCPEPTLWSAYQDGGGAEVETHVWLESMVHLLKPKTVVETGSYFGWSATAMAKGCRDNGFGHVFTFEINDTWIAKARAFAMAEGVGDWVTFLHGDSHTMPWPETSVDLMFCDGSDDRVGEIRRFQPFLSSRALVLAHDAIGGGEYNPQFVWHRLQEEFVRVLLPTPRGLWIMQRRGVPEVEAALREV